MLNDVIRFILFVNSYFSRKQRKLSCFNRKRINRPELRTGTCKVREGRATLHPGAVIAARKPGPSRELSAYQPDFVSATGSPSRALSWPASEFDYAASASIVAGRPI